MSVLRRGMLLASRGLRMLGRQVCERVPGRQVWIDVGAHYGETTFPRAYEDPSLTVYAFEPNWEVASTRVGVLPNFHVLPLAVAESDGCAEFYLNEYSEASSLLPFDEDRLEQWVDGHVLEKRRTISVPTMRLDTFMNGLKLARVDFLKVDAQGADLAVVRSAGERIKDIARIRVEVAATDTPLYRGASSRSEIESWLDGAGFELVAAENQSHGQEQNLTFRNRRLA